MSGYDYYDTHANEYFRKTLSASKNNIYTFLEISGINPKDKKILDLGCGSCRDTLEFKKLGANVLSLDGSKELAKVVKEELGIDVMVKDILDINYKSEFDIIWACASLVHFNRKDTVEALRKCKSAVKSDGMIYVSIKLGASKEADRHFETYTEEEFMDMISSAGLIPIATWHNDDSIGRTVDWFNVACKK